MRSLATLLKDGEISKELLRILKCASKIRKVQRLNIYFQEHPDEREEYAEQYKPLARDLKAKQKVNTCVPRGASKASYNRIFILASVASGHMLMNPLEYIHEGNGEAAKKAAPPMGRAGSARTYKLGTINPKE